MNDALRYRLIDEPRPGPLQRLALPPFLVFLIAQFFMPWGALLVTLNAAALNGPHRNREMALSIGPIASWFTGLLTLDALLRAGILTNDQAHYFFVLAVGAGLFCLALAYVSQAETAELRQYLRRQG